MGNLSVYLPVSVTNRVDANNLTLDAVLLVDYGSGFVPTGKAGLISNQIIAYNGLSFTVPTSGNLSLKISNLRGAVYQLGGMIPQRLIAQIAFSSFASTVVDQPLVTVAFVQPGLFATLSNRGTITCTASPVPDTLNLTNLFAAGTAFASTRVTEGFATAFLPRRPGDDTGTRFLVKYSGFPANTLLYVPDFVSGSGSVAPTAGGDLGLPQQVGKYLPGSSTLLLARVQFPDANGFGGLVTFAPTGTDPVTLNSVGQVPLVNGSGIAVYEVVDANPNRLETAQFPTFVGIADIVTPAIAQETISFAPVSSVTTASASAPVPRFATVAPPSDCSVLGDCNASYYPHLSVLPNPIQLTATAGGAMSSQPGYIAIDNSGGGVMRWTATVNYVDGSGWLTLDYTSGQNNGSVRTFAKPQGLAAGTYRANVVIDAGALAGSQSIPVTLTVLPAPSIPSNPAPTTPPPTTPTPPAAPAVAVSQVINAATLQVTPLVPGSLGTLMGSNLSGRSVVVTFDDLSATLLYADARQINLRVPAGLGSRTSAQLVVAVDGNRSAPYAVALSPAWPSLFSNGVLNQDNTINSLDHPAKAGSILQIYATGIPDSATVSVLIGDRSNLVPLYAGPAPDVPGVQQVNVAIPDDLAVSNTQVAICATAGAQQYCSTGYPIAIQ